MADQYGDLKVHIRAADAAGVYPVEAELDDGSRYTGGQLKLDRAALLASELDAAAYGRLLFDALLAGPIRSGYDKASARAEALTGGRLRVQLWLDAEAAELHALPWERLYHLSRNFMVPLTTSDLTPFSRYTSLATPEPAPVAERPIRVLAALANPLNLPGGLPPANSEVELQNLRRAFGDLRQNKQWQVALLPGRSGLPDALRAQLTTEGYQLLDGNTTLDNLVRYLPGRHVFHFIGHGSFRRQTERGAGQAVLHLEDEAGNWKVAKDDDLVARFAAIGEQPRLVFLVACETAVRDAKAEDAFVGLGPKLVQAGFPAVVAMQAQVPVETARQLTGEFYQRLMAHGVVDRAMSEARRLMFKPERVDWGIPVLFMRLKTGELFATPAKERNMTDEKSDQGGGIHISGGGSINIGGDMVGRDKITTTVTHVNTTSGVDAAQLVALLQQFAEIKRKVDKLPGVDDDDKEDLRSNVQRIEDEVKKGDGADGSKVEKALKKIAGMSDDILQVVAAALVNPAAGIAKTIQLIAQKAKAG